MLGSGSVPLATAADRRDFVTVAAGPAGQALVNNRYSADIVALAGASAVLAGLPDLASDNELPRWLAESAGVAVADRRGRWRLQVDLDSRSTHSSSGVTRRGPQSVHPPARSVRPWPVSPPSPGIHAPSSSSPGGPPRPGLPGWNGRPRRGPGR